MKCIQNLTNVVIKLHLPGNKTDLLSVINNTTILQFLKQFFMAKCIVVELLLERTATVVVQFPTLILMYSPPVNNWITS